MTEHIAGVNDQLRKLGLGYMIEEGAVRRTIQDHCPCLRRDMVCNVLLQDRDIGKKEITAKAVDQDTGNSMDLVALRQIPEMFVPRLNTQKAPCRFGGTDDHFRKRKDHTDQNAVDRTQQQNADKSTDKNKELRPTDLPQSCRIFPQCLLWMP